MADFRFLAPLAVLLGLLWFVPAASATHVQCGDVITQDTTLDSDLVDCPGHGIVVGAGNVSLDLNGHAIEGGSGGVGVLNADGNEGMIVSGGVIRGFQSGVISVGGSGNTVTQMHLDNNSVFGVALSGTHGGEVTGNRVSGGVGGVLIDAGADNRVADNTVGGSSSYGILVSGSDSNDVVANTLTEDGVGVHLTNGADGNVVSGNSFALNGGRFAGFSFDGSIVVLDSARNTIARNAIDQTTGLVAIGLVRAPESRVLTNQLATGENGIVLLESEGVLVSDNSVRDHEGGIHVGRDSRLNFVGRNEVSGSSFAGFSLQGSSNNSFTDNRVSDSGTGILLTSEVSDNVFRGNLVTGSQGAGIMLDGVRASIGGVPEGNHFVGNHVISNAGDGLLSDSPFTGTIVRNNVFERNRDGLALYGPSNTVADNRADRNRDLGIRANPGVVDGGGNRAKHNGNPAQCVGVQCR